MKLLRVVYSTYDVACAELRVSTLLIEEEKKKRVRL